MKITTHAGKTFVAGAYTTYEYETITEALKVSPMAYSFAKGKDSTDGAILKVGDEVLDFHLALGLFLEGGESLVLAKMKALRDARQK